MPDNYRLILLVNTTSEVFTSIMPEHCLVLIGMAQEQQGFRTNWRPTDASFMIRQLIEKSTEYNNPAFLCFVDLTMAKGQVR